MITLAREYYWHPWWSSIHKWYQLEPVILLLYSYPLSTINVTKWVCILWWQNDPPISLLILFPWYYILFYFFKPYIDIQWNMWCWNQLSVVDHLLTYYFNVYKIRPCRNYSKIHPCLWTSMIKHCHVQQLRLIRITTKLSCKN